jgi:hypothetical protein
LYFAASKSPLDEAIIALNGSLSGMVNNVCVPSDVASEYAPAGQSLISVSVLGTPPLEGAESLQSQVLAELESWFGHEVRAWRHLRTYQIQRALPMLPPNLGMTGPGYQHHGCVYICGDHQWSASIEGAIISGSRTADAILRTA